jgi:hypothetical protein
MTGWVSLFAVTAVLSGGAVLLARGTARRRALLLAVATGVLYGVTSAVTEHTGHVLDRGALHTLTTWAPYVLAVISIVGLLVNQSAYQAGDLRLSLPTFTVLEPIVAILIGQFLFSEHIASGAGDRHGGRGVLADRRRPRGGGRRRPGGRRLSVGSGPCHRSASPTSVDLHGGNSVLLRVACREIQVRHGLLTFLVHSHLPVDQGAREAPTRSRASPCPAVQGRRPWSYAPPPRPGRPGPGRAVASRMVVFVPPASSTWAGVREDRPVSYPEA